ncbi:MAG: hypothetical protein ACYDB7_13340 [Mycobacteriales bacterium]
MSTDHFLAGLGPVGGVGPGALSAAGGLVDAADDRRVGHVQADDPVVAGQRFLDNGAGHPGRDTPAKRPGGRAAWLPSLAEPPGVFPGAAVTSRMTIASKQRQSARHGR